MAWDHLSITKPHLVYLVLGGFTTLFMLCSSIIKERLYIGEATVATICGIIFGPHAADVIDPGTWGNTDSITLEFARIVLVVQCFAVGVELPKAYMERHWKSVVFLLLPVMTFGWLMTSLFIWWMFGSHLNWLDSLCCAACVTATDPVLASSVVGKGKFAKRVPKHLRDLLSAESGCNDGMAFPFVYLAIYIIRYRHEPSHVALHWFCVSILYECVFGAVYGVMIGYIARRAIRFAHERDLIDRESFLVFYFVLALFCAGSGALLGMDDLLIGFACGVGFSNDGWFLEKTEESHVSNVIDLLINLAFFVYFGTIIPWETYNSALIGTSPWRLVVLGILVLFFRRIPIMVLLKPIIPDIKTWRESVFAGHFGPIGVGGLFVAILARAELETDSTTPLAELPEEGFEHLNIIELIWPITTFLVIVSIMVHGSSIAVFTLGKHINTLTLTLSYTQANEEGPSWMDRLPRIQSRSKSQMSSMRRGSTDADSMDEKAPPGQLLPVGFPGNFLRRQKEEDTPGRPSSRRRKWDAGRGPGGPISQSAIAPASRVKEQPSGPNGKDDSDATTAVVSDESSPDTKEKSPHGDYGEHGEPEEEIYREGNKFIIEDEEGNVLDVQDESGETDMEKCASEQKAALRAMREQDVEHGVSQKLHHSVPGDHGETPRYHRGDEEHPEAAIEYGEGRTDTGRRPTLPASRPTWSERLTKKRTAPGQEPTPVEKRAAARRGAARAYQFGNTIIVEDEDGEVIKQYDIPAEGKGSSRTGAPERGGSFMGVGTGKTHQRLQNMRAHLGLRPGGGGAGGAIPKGNTPIEEPEAESSTAAGTTAAGASSAAAGAAGGAAAAKKKEKAKAEQDTDDERIRFTLEVGGRRMSKADFIKEVQKRDPKGRAEYVERSNAPEAVKNEARQDLKDHKQQQLAQQQQAETQRPTAATQATAIGPSGEKGKIQKRDPSDSRRPSGPSGLTFIEESERGKEVPFHPVGSDISSRNASGRHETAAQRRRRQLSSPSENTPSTPVSEEPSPGTEIPPEATKRDDGDREEEGEESSMSLSSKSSTISARAKSKMDEGETAAERRRREGALGVHHPDEESESDEEELTGKGMRSLPPTGNSGGGAKSRGIRFADDVDWAGTASGSVAGGGSGGEGNRGSVRWGDDVKSAK